MEPWATEHNRKEHDRRLCGAGAFLGWLRELIRVVLLLGQHLPPEARKQLVTAAFLASPDTFVCAPEGDPGHGRAWGRHYPALMIALPELLAEEGPTYQGPPCC